ncbi:mucin desulfatase, partial [Faecalibacterium prausnitzii]|nr:mucin desulfatase [Faecalibacterium prausnitzii]
RIHDTPNRYANIEKALAADALGRAKNITSEIEFIHARKQDCHVLLDQLAAGEIPLRVTHNDTKINNVLI